jgi:hypothetical protein
MSRWGLRRGVAERLFEEALQVIGGSLIVFAALSPIGRHDLDWDSTAADNRLANEDTRRSACPGHGLRTAIGRLEGTGQGVGVDGCRSGQSTVGQAFEARTALLFTFLRCPGLDATNHAAEQAIRGMVIARKVWGGNRAWEGARTQQVLVSILRPCWQQDKDAFPRVVSLMRTPQEVILDIVPGSG